MGSLAAAFLTEFLEPSYAFFINSFFGLFIAIAGWKISRSTE